MLKRRQKRGRVLSEHDKRVRREFNMLVHHGLLAVCDVLDGDSPEHAISKAKIRLLREARVKRFVKSQRAIGWAHAICDGIPKGFCFVATLTLDCGHQVQWSSPTFISRTQQSPAPPEMVECRMCEREDISGRVLSVAPESRPRNGSRSTAEGILLARSGDRTES